MFSMEKICYHLFNLDITLHFKIFNKITTLCSKNDENTCLFSRCWRRVNVQLAHTLS